MATNRSRMIPTARAARLQRALWGLLLCACAARAVEVPAAGTTIDATPGAADAVDLVPPFYIVVFHVDVDAAGRVGTFVVERVHDVRSPNLALVDVSVAEVFFEAVRARTEAQWERSPPTAEERERHAVSAYYDPATPARADIGARGEGVRLPFLLRLGVGAGRTRVQRIAASSYVQDGSVLLMHGDVFGARFDAGGELHYEDDPARAEIVFEFRQLADGAPVGGMRLAIENRTAHRLRFEATMSLPDAGRPIETGAVTIEPRSTAVAGWAQPIEALRLDRLRIDAPPRDR
jgi:hypothetical protein